MVARSRTLRAAADGGVGAASIRGDTWWGVAAGLWIVTGLWRLIAGTEKAMTYYMHNHIFFAKMGFLVLILVLEVQPMITLIRWRVAVATQGDAWRADASIARRVATISYIEAALVIAMVIAAVLMARGFGAM